jgi:hypothetical protein
VQLKNIWFSLLPEGPQKEYNKAFQKQTMVLTYYLSQQEKAKQGDYGDFSMLHLIASGNYNAGFEDWMDVKKDTLCLTFYVNTSAFFRFYNDRDKLEYLCQILRDASFAFADRYPALMQSLRSSLDDFRRQGFKNEWVLDRGEVGKLNLTYEVRCVLTCEHYYAMFILFQEGKEVYTQDIYLSIPNELYVELKLKKVVRKQDRLELWGIAKKPIHTISLNDKALAISLQKGKKQKKGA